MCKGLLVFGAQLKVLSEFSDSAVSPADPIPVYSVVNAFQGLVIVKVTPTYKAVRNCLTKPLTINIGLYGVQIYFERC